MADYYGEKKFSFVYKNINIVPKVLVNYAYSACLFIFLFHLTWCYSGELFNSNANQIPVRMNEWMNELEGQFSTEHPWSWAGPVIILKLKQVGGLSLIVAYSDLKIWEQECVKVMLSLN